MTYASLFGEECSVAEVKKILAGDWDKGAFGGALKEASEAFASSPDSHKVSITHVFKRCVSILSEHNNNSSLKEGLGSADPHAVLETEQLNLSQFHNAELDTSSSHPRVEVSEKVPLSANHDDGDDITDITNTDSTFLSAPETEDSNLHLKNAPTPTEPSTPGFEGTGTSEKEQEKAPEFSTTMGRNIFRLFNVWFNVLSHEPASNNHNLLLAVFSSEESDELLSDNDLSSLLFETNTFLNRAIKSNDLTLAESIKESVHMIHGILAAIFKTIGLEAKHGTPQTALILKKLLHMFYRVDFSITFGSLLELTTSKLLFANNQEEAKVLQEKMAAHQSLRLSYVTLSKILVCIASLANCPKNLFLEKKSSDSSDITAIGNNYFNVYSNTMQNFNFADPKNIALFESRIIPYLAADFNLYYEYSPDLLQHSLKHSSFFTWITGDALSSSSYLYTHTVEDLTDFENQPLDPHDPFLYEVEYFEHKLKLRKLHSENQQNTDLSCPSYLMISTLILLYVDNPSFVEYLCKSKDSRIPLLNIWLCVSSYVHHYQYKSEINKKGTRMFLLAMLKLTSSGSTFLKLAADGYTINESSWKFCHHKSPFIPVNKENENRPILFYVMDVLQVTFRFNLSRKLSLTNVKLALTVLYQILIYYEAHPTEDLKTYHWKELYVALANLLRFIAKTHNEESVKLVVEETFATFDLLLSPVFDKVIVDTVSTRFFGSHLVKSMNYDLLYIMLQQREILFGLFTRYIVQTDNFPRVEKSFDTFEEKLSAIKTEISEHDVQQMISGLSILSEEEVRLTSVTLEDFNNVDTFKYLDRFIDESSEQIRENTEVSQLLLANEWMPSKIQ